MKNPTFLNSLIPYILLFLTIPGFADQPFRVPYIVTSEFHSTTGKGGERRNNIHQGVDIIPVSYDYIIFPIMPGVIFEIGIDPVFGKYVIVEHDEGIFSLYAHGLIMYDTARAGNAVNNLVPIMRMGSTGYSDGNHVHIEVYEIIEGVKINYDPIDYFENKKEKTMSNYGTDLTLAESAEFTQAIDNLDNLEIKPEMMPDTDYNPSTENQGELF